MKKITKAICLFLVISFVSCSDETLEEPENEKASLLSHTEFSVIDGKIKFQSQQSLVAFMDKDPEVIRNSVSEISGKQFKTLRPFFEEGETKQIDNFLKNKQQKIKSSNYLYSLKSGEDDEEIDLDDELISDENFASILNEQRELYVGDSIYIYTTDGVYFTSIEKEYLLLDYLENLGKESLKSEIIQKKKQEMKNFQKIEESQISTLSIEPIEGRVTSIDENISLYQPLMIAPDEPYSGGGGGGGGYTGGGTPTTGQDDFPILKPKTFGSCAYSPGSLWQQVFGERVKCNDYHDDDHRIQTQFYNENYYVYATIGSKAKYQKKRFIGWSESSTAEFVELGVNYVKFDYVFNEPQFNPFDLKYLTFNYEGITYDSFGQVQDYNTPSPTNWPFRDGLVTLQITIAAIGIHRGQDDPYVFDGAVANSAIKSLITLAGQNVPGLARNLIDNKVAIEIVKFSPGQATMLFNNRVIRDGSNAQKNFDFNFLAEYSNDFDYKKLSSYFDQLNAKRYKNVSVDIYGAALRNNVWKGKRIIGNN